MGLFDAPDPEPAEVAGYRIDCQVCRHGLFWHRRAQLHGAAATLFNVEWASPSADCYVCARCGYVHWFLPLAA